ncbi:XRE family transcriptional regulator [Cryobacterium sp. TMT2-18-3]|uniref:helix-turn-helix domain-containing protein n=1 Tax=unclassified Cryobacterium TaxID=2649013 RepID=UPI00106AC9CC|nr:MULTISPECIES: helix-turn-helix transcriptional regulator [unclassified Cryobacterium]TFC31463.1 XRE family transcriptional regulator [Cryobacterium sp. TMT2-18-2]TFC37939.1 XRE family transcriptional regulator [Cryobacterium sp. TMT2-42-4]TFC58025.1 XRE family transcriptional regulator [Cryobacterium sp. TMT2-15-1]TFC65823.1 XRE family transcriptional regulator [Cryobacterium sp. TMT2-18-3]
MSPRPARVAPHELCVDWPTMPSDDPVAEIARRLVLNLREAIGDRSIREVARVTGVDRATIAAVLNGLSWPDIVTLAKLEIGLHLLLWPPRAGETA